MRTVLISAAQELGGYEVKFGPASWKGIEVCSGETTTIETGVLKVEVGNPGVFVSANVVDSETGDKHGAFHPMASTLTLMPGVYDLRFAKTEWRFIKVKRARFESAVWAIVVVASAALIGAAGLNQAALAQQAQTAGIPGR